MPCVHKQKNLFGFDRIRTPHTERRHHLWAHRLSGGPPLVAPAYVALPRATVPWIGTFARLFSQEFRQRSSQFDVQKAQAL